ncbi:MAG: TIGR04282 family arsenosugar biosynthesis glycosyltransferase [Nocardioidaceae bacterium]
MRTPTALVVAKAPVPGRAKTRLATHIGHEAAARIAAAALLDTIDVVERLDWPVVVAMTGRLGEAARGAEISAALEPHRVVPQRGADFAARLAAAHADADSGHGVVQVGMDTPHATAADLREAGDALRTHTAVLGPAEDGGWWVLGVRDAGLAAGLAQVPMSRPDTGTLTRAALVAEGATVADARTLSDVDTWHEARTVAALAPGTRFAAEVARTRELDPEAAR